MLREDIKDIFQNEKIQIKWLSDEKKNWDNIVHMSAYAPVYYDSYFVLYQNQYFSEVYEEYQDLSLLVYNGGVPVFILPLCIYKKEGRYYLGSEGEDIFSPLFADSIQNEEGKRKILKKFINTLRKIASEYVIDELKFKNLIMDDGVNLWTRLLLEFGGENVSIDIEAYVDLSMKEEEILKKIRRTNKYSISKGRELWSYRIVSKANTTEEIDDAIKEFRQLHIEVAGRETRSKKTWELQEDGIINSDDFIIMLYDNEKVLIGASLYQTTNSSGMYSVAAYKRELFDKPVAHVSQWLAICHMKEIGIKWYYVGRRFYEKDIENPSEKEMQIGHFKEGFATNFFTNVHTSIKVK